ncbi:MAG: hypothetical protein MHMPM18_001680 [Marteilia pararefringens]
MAWRSSLLLKYSHNNCHNTKVILICIILILVIILICIIPLTMARSRRNKKVIHFNKDSSFNDSFNRSVRSLSSASNSRQQQQQQQNLGVSGPNSSEFVQNPFDERSEAHRMRLQRNPSSSVDIGQTNRFDR